MKFIDQNSKFEAPNHVNYSGWYGTYYFDADTSTSNTLKHRWQGISQAMPHAMESQGIKVGDEVTVSWWQKSDTINKGARVGLYHYKKNDPDDARFWGSVLGDQSEVEEITNTGHQREWLRYKPITKIG